MKKLIFLISILLHTANSFAQGHFVVAYAGNGQDHMNIMIVSATINGAPLKAGDEIAVFDGPVCCGKSILAQPIVFSDAGTFAKLTASRKDEGQANGYTIGNAITFKLWDSGKSTELSGITTEFINPVNGQTISAPVYAPGATAFVKLSGTSQASKTPVSNAGSDQSVNEGDNVILDGTASSDPDNDSLTYLWTAPAGITLSSTSAAKPTFKAPEVKQDTVLNFSLTVSDGITSSKPSTVKVFVVNVIKTGTEIFGTNGIKVYPNPSKGIFNIEGLKTVHQNKIEIYTIDGKLIRQEKSKLTRETVDIRGEVSGTYLLVINKSPIKIIKE